MPLLRMITNSIAQIGIRLSAEDLVTKITAKTTRVTSSLLGEAILHTAKFAVNTLGSNNNNNNNTATTLLEESLTSPYNDVCDFDNKLCQEIEDALAATESFKLSTEKSKTAQNTMFDREGHHGVGNSGDGVQYDVNISFDNDSTFNKHQDTSTQ